MVDDRPGGEWVSVVVDPLADYYHVLVGMLYIGEDN